MHIRICMYIYLSLSLSLYIYIYMGGPLLGRLLPHEGGSSIGTIM